MHRVPVQKRALCCFRASGAHIYFISSCQTNSNSANCRNYFCPPAPTHIEFFRTPKQKHFPLAKLESRERKNKRAESMYDMRRGCSTHTSQVLTSSKACRHCAYINIYTHTESTVAMTDRVLAAAYRAALAVCSHIYIYISI